MFTEMQKQQLVNGNCFLLDPRIKCSRAEDFETKLSARIVGQEKAVRRVSDLYQLFLAGLNPTNRPIGTMLFLVPT